MYKYENSRRHELYMEEKEKRKEKEKEYKNKETFSSTSRNSSRIIIRTHTEKPPLD